MKFVIVIEWLLGLWGAFALYVALVCGIAFFDASTPENLAMFLLSGCAALFSFCSDRGAGTASEKAADIA